MDHPLAQRADHPRTFCHGDKAPGGDHALVRVHPAHQGLGAQQATGGNLHLRLVVQLQVALRQRYAQACFQLQAFTGSLGHVAVVEAPGTPAPGLGAVHGRMRALQ